jgi:hypothetical protein
MTPTHHLKMLCMVLALCGSHGHISKMAVSLNLAAQFDAATTYTVLNTIPGSREGNPLLRPFASNPSIFPVVAATSLSLNWLARREGSHGHGRVAFWIRALTIGSHVACGVHNITLLNHQPQRRQ